MHRLAHAESEAGPRVKRRQRMLHGDDSVHSEDSSRPIPRRSPNRDRVGWLDVETLPLGRGLWIAPPTAGCRRPTALRVCVRLCVSHNRNIQLICVPRRSHRKHPHKNTPSLSLSSPTSCQNQPGERKHQGHGKSIAQEPERARVTVWRSDRVQLAQRRGDGVDQFMTPRHLGLPQWHAIFSRSTANL